MTQIVRAEVTEVPLDLAELQRQVHDAAESGAGAVVGFSGDVRNHDDGRGVTALHYSAHPTAGAVLAELVASLDVDAGVRAIGVAHRVGDLQVGDTAFVVAVAAEHRRAAFETCARVVDEVKAALPVWKHQHFDDGTDEWVGSA